jgi:ATP-dependent DNA helicase RecQ
LPNSFIENARPSTIQYSKVIKLLKEEPLSEREIMKKANLKQGQIRIIKEDLIDQGIIKAVEYGKVKRYEYQYKAKPLDTSEFEKLRVSKRKDLDSMVEYVYTKLPRMQYLCDYLDNTVEQVYSNCDNTSLPKLDIKPNKYLEEKLQQYRETFFPKLELAQSTSKFRTGFKIKTPIPNHFEIYQYNELLCSFNGNFKIKGFPSDTTQIINEIYEKHILSACKLTDGYAASYYGVSNVGAALHRCKYEDGGDFPDFLVKKVLSLLGKKYRTIKFDLILYVPPTRSGDLVKNFAEKISRVIQVPICHNLVKIRKTEEQKIFQNSYCKQDNVKDAFDIKGNIVKNKTILLIDDIYDSGATIKEIGKMLSDKGAKWIVPIVIAKTVGGTL